MRPTFVAMRWAGGIPPSRRRPYYKLRTTEGKRAVATGIFIYTDRGGARRKNTNKKGRRFFEKRNSNKHSASVEYGSSGSFILFISITIVATAFLNEREPATPEEATKNISP